MSYIINDKCVTVSESEIRIPWYFFPLGATKHINLDTIQSVKGYSKHYSQKIGWGSSLEFGIVVRE